MRNHLFALAAMCVLAAPAHAEVNVTAPWVRATVPAQKSTGAFMHLHSPDGSRLVGVSSPVAAQVEIHKSEMKNDMMKMARVDAIELPAGKGVNLASGGYHIMLVGLKRQLQAGEAVDLTLTVQGRGQKPEQITVKVPVKPLTFVPPNGAAHAAH